MDAEKNCHKTIIGITQKNTTLDGYITEYSESKSKLYIDELQGIILNTDCDSTIWDMLLRSRENAWQQVRNDISIGLTKSNEKKIYNKNVDIGNVDFMTLMQCSTWAGIMLYSTLKGIEITIKSITVTPYDSGTFTVKVLTESGEVYSKDIETNHKKPLTIHPETPLKFLMPEKVSVLVSTNKKIYTNNLGCCGSDASYFDIKTPIYKDTDRKEWRKWIMATGVTGESLNINDLTLIKGSGVGISINAQINCDDYGMFCSENSDFIGDTIDRAIAFALWYKSGEQFLSEMVSTGEVNRYVLLSYEAIQNLVKFYNERYTLMIEFVSKHMHLDMVACWECKKKYNILNRFGI